tara:strand:- start:8636 stop:9943 length:1308 start_codon:yes stop_codon:yes gene_type:complete
MAFSDKPLQSTYKSSAYLQVNKPSWFTHTPPFIVKREAGAERFTTSLNIEDYKITPTTTYYVSNTGSSGNTGLTSDSPKGDVDQAIALGNASGAPYEIRVAEGTYHRNRDWTSTPTQDCNIIGEGSGAVLSAQEDGLSFTLTSSNTYTTNRSNVASVYDHDYIDGFGNAKRLKKVTSQAECEATAGTWAQVGSALYIHAHDDRNLATSYGGMKAYLKVNSPKISDDVHVYLENLHMEGFQTTCFEARNNGSGQTPELYMNTVSLKYCYNGNGMSLNGVSLYVGQNIVTGENWLDGLNYHSRAGVVPIVYEIGVRHYNNGRSGESNTNGTTIHDGSAAIRVDVFSTGAGRAVHDVSNGSQSWNVDVRVGDSNTSVAEKGAAFANGTTSGDTSLMQLDYCGAIEGQCPFDLLAENGSTTYLNNTSLPNRSGTGTVVE